MRELNWLTIKRAFNSGDDEARLVAINACIGRDDVTLDMAARMFMIDGGECHLAARQVFVLDKTPYSVIRRRLTSPKMFERLKAMMSCRGRRDVPLDIIRIGATDASAYVREATAMVLRTTSISEEDISKLILEEPLFDTALREDFFYHEAEQEEDQPLWPIQTEPSSSKVTRSYEPPSLVYKKCVQDVIVTAKIPRDAEVRGNPNTRSRSNKAEIVAIEGTFFGESVGVSFHDYKTLYRVGDKVVIDNFDYSNAIATTGFHFFTTKDLAINY